MKAACVLYNFCIMEGDNYGDDQQDRGSSLIRWDSMVTITQMEKPQGNLLWLNLLPGELYRRVKLVQAWLFYWRLRWLGKVDPARKLFLHYYTLKSSTITVSFAYNFGCVVKLLFMTSSDVTNTLPFLMTSEN